MCDKDLFYYLLINTYIHVQATPWRAQTEQRTRLRVSFMLELEI